MMDDTDYKAKMQEVQKEHRRKTSQAQDPDRGLVLVHTGKGKGKWVTGERRFFKTIEDQVSWHTMGDGFTWDTQDRNRDTEAAQAAFAKACEIMSGGEFDLVVLDEINIAMRYEYLSVDQVLEGLEGRAARTSVILTGRDAKPALCDYADLVTEMTEVKHPFQAGIKAQKGLDF